MCTARAQPLHITLIQLMMRRVEHLLSPEGTLRVMRLLQSECFLRLRTGSSRGECLDCTRSANDVQLAKAAAPIVVTLSGIATVVNEVQL